MSSVKHCRVVGAVLIFAGMWVATLRGDELRVGVASSDITPGNNYPVSGYYSERLSTGTKDPLQAKAIVFRQGKESAAFVVCDLIAIASDLSAEIRTRVEKQTGIPGDHVVIAATHTHTGPDYGRELFSVVTGRPLPANWKDRQPYVPKMIDAVTAAVVSASEAAKPVQILAGVTTQQTPVAFHRRYLLKNGEYRTWIGLKDPSVLRTAGPIDPEIGMLLIRDAEQKTSAILSSHALHLDTVGGTLWSADYPFFIERTLQASLGGNFISLFANGCCGNINHVDPNSAIPRSSAELIGTTLGKTIAAAVPQLTEVDAPLLQVQKQVVKLPLQHSTSEQLARSKRLLHEIAGGKEADFYEHVDAYKRIVLEQFRAKPDVEETMSLIGWGLCNSKAGSGETLPVDVQVITLGRDFAIVALPGEVFVEYGQQIKAASPFRTTLVVELCNNSETIYIPTRNAYIPTRDSFTAGGYEVVNSTTLPGSGDMLVDAAIRMLIDCARRVSK